MIVIASHNGEKYLKDLLADIKRFNISNNKVCVVDNLSTEESHLEYLKKLKEEGYNILYNPKSTYELGAFKYAVDNLKDDVWFSMQDSIRIKYDIFSEVKPKLTPDNMYTFLTFPYAAYDNNDDRTFLLMRYGTMKYSKGVYASSIFALDEVVQRVKDDWFIPRNKIDAAGSERGVAVIFDRYNIEINGLGIYEPNKSSDPEGYPFFSKIYGGRGR
jgi:glycosyltransferase involved in cell wall biosynthesis